MRRAQRRVQAVKQGGKAGKEQKRAADAMQNRNYCRERLPDLQQVQILRALFLQFGFPWRGPESLFQKQAISGLP